MAIQQDTSPMAAAQNLPSEVKDTAPAENPGFIRRNSLRLAGWLNAIGDVAMLATGVKKRDPNLIATGALYTGGALTLARYGKTDTKRQLEEVSIGVAELIENRIGDLPEGSELATLMARKRNEGAFQKTEDFLYRNSANVMLGAYTAGAGTALASGIKNKNGMTGYGLWSLAVKAASFLTPEKYKNKTADSSSKGLGWFTDQPLRIFGIGSMISEVLLSRKFFKDYKSTNSEEKRAAVFGLGAAGAYMASDMLMTISNKEPANASNKFTTVDQQRIEALAAGAIAKVSQDKQRDLVIEIAAFLADRPEVQGTAGDIAAAIQNQMAQKDQSNWVARMAESQDNPQLTLNR